MSPEAPALTVARNAAEIDTPIAIEPPVEPLAPVPKRIRTVREAARYSP